MLNGNADAMYMLGCAYENGNLGLSKDEAEAQSWYVMAATAGNEMAQLIVDGKLIVHFGVSFNKHLYTCAIPEDEFDEYLRKKIANNPTWIAWKERSINQHGEETGLKYYESMVEKLILYGKSK